MEVEDAVHTPSPVRRNERKHQRWALVLSSFAVFFFFQISKVRRQTLSSLSSFGSEMEANALLLSNRVRILNSELILQNQGYNHLIPGRRAKEFL